MAYLLLIHEPRGQRATRTRAEGEDAFNKMSAWGQGLTERGLLRAAESLAEDAHATRVQKRGGKLSYHDGPFSEAKEMVGGFFLLDCKTKDEALAIAAECPAAQWATVEVRAVGTCYDELE